MYLCYRLRLASRTRNHQAMLAHPGGLVGYDALAFLAGHNEKAGIRRLFPSRSESPFLRSSHTIPLHAIDAEIAQEVQLFVGFH